MFYTILFIHCSLCVVLIGLVLMQQGKGADMGAAFGGNSSSLFGAGGATDFITKLTTSLAIGFMITSILLVRTYSGFTQTSVSTFDPLEGSVLQVEEAPAVAVTDVAVPAADDAPPADKLPDPVAEE